MNAPVVGSGELLLAILQQALETGDALISGNEFPLGNSDFLLQRSILLNKLSLDLSQLL